MQDEGAVSYLVTGNKVRGYGIALLSVALAAAIKLSLEPLIREESPFLIFLAAIMISAIYGGFGPGIVAMLSSALISDLLFLHPGEFLAQDAGSNMRLGIFVVEGTVVSVFGASLTRSRTRSVEALEKLADSETRYRAVVEQSAEGLFLLDAASLRIKDTNPALRRMLGYTSGELAAMTVHDLVHNPQELVDSGARQASSQGEARYTESWCRKKDGTPLPVEVAASYISYARKRSICVNVRDISERKRQQADLQQSKDRLRLAVDAAGMGIWDYNPATGMVDCDQHTRKAFGIPAGEDATYEAMMSRLHEEDRPETARAIGEAFTPGGPYANGYEIQFRLTDEDTGWRWIQASGKVFSSYEGGRRLIGTVLDITERKESEEAAQQVREAERSRIARELHDTVLQSIVYALQEAQIAEQFSEQPSPRFKEIAETLRRSVEDLRAAIFEIRLDETSARSVRESLEALVDLGRRVSRGAYVIELTVEDDFPDTAFPENLRELLRILQEALTNAHRHAGANKVEIILRTEPGETVAEVSDDGRGYTPGFGRTGIGTHSMHQRARNLGGKLSVQSSPGLGTRVETRIPMQSLSPSQPESEIRQR